MMVFLAPPGENAAHRAIERILETLGSDDYLLPTHVLVDDGCGTWRRFAALLPVEERRCSVIAAGSQACLIDAVRFEIGGAFWLPASTASMEAACEAAANARQVKIAPYATRGVVETVIADAGELWAMGWWPWAFWQGQLGSARLRASLTAIADRLGCVACVLPGPVLLVAGRNRSELEVAWSDELTGDGSMLPAPPTIVDLSAALGSADSPIPVERVHAAVVGHNSAAQDCSGVVLSVREMPSGHRVGGWSPSTEARAHGPGWLATPAPGEHGGESWQLLGDAGAPEIVVDTISPSEGSSPAQSVIRVPGWLGAELRFGSPAGLLVEQLARHEGRAGRPLWVPSVDAAGVHFLLTLPGPIWVDGPGVPG
jgi:hypothetical protein